MSNDNNDGFGDDWLIKPAIPSDEPPQEMAPSAYEPVPPVSVTCRVVVGALAATVMLAETVLPFTAAVTPEIVTPSGGVTLIPVMAESAPRPSCTSWKRCSASVKSPAMV